MDKIKALFGSLHISAASGQRYTFLSTLFTWKIALSV